MEKIQATFTCKDLKTGALFSVRAIGCSKWHADLYANVMCREMDVIAYVEKRDFEVVR